MFRNKIFVVVLITLLIWEAGIFFISSHLSNLDTVKYQLAARYSARTSFVIIALILLWTGIQGLQRIYGSEDLRKLFVLSLLIFAVNHLIHFIYIVLNFKANHLDLLQGKNVFGAIGYVMLSFAPVYLWSKKKLSKSLYIQIYIFLFVIISIFFVTYLGRLSKPVVVTSPLILYDLCLVFIGLVFFLNVYRLLVKRGNP